MDLKSEKKVDRACAISNLMELQLVSLWFSDNGSPWSRTEMEPRYNNVRTQLLRLCEELKNNAGKDVWEIVSRRRQSSRYINWFYSGFPMYLVFESFEGFPGDVPCLIKGLCQELLDRLPEQDEFSLEGCMGEIGQLYYLTTSE